MVTGVTLGKIWINQILSRLESRDDIPTFSVNDKSRHRDIQSQFTAAGCRGVKSDTSEKPVSGAGEFRVAISSGLGTSEVGSLEPFPCSVVKRMRYIARSSSSGNLLWPMTTLCNDGC